jgi:hypothetical protein
MVNSRSLFQNSVAALCQDAATPERFSKKLEAAVFS